MCALFCLSCVMLTNEQLGTLALTCVSTHDSLAHLSAMRAEIGKYVPPAQWPVVFSEEEKRTEWLTQLTSSIWSEYCTAVKEANLQPVAYQPFNFDLSHPSTMRFSWQRANPVTLHDMTDRIRGNIAGKDALLLSSYALSEPALLLRKWWDELNGWCRAYMAQEAQRNYHDDTDQPSYPVCPCDACAKEAVQDMLEAMLSDTGFDFCRRVRYELESIFPPSKQGLRRAAIN